MKHLQQRRADLWKVRPRDGTRNRFKSAVARGAERDVLAFWHGSLEPRLSVWDCVPESYHRHSAGKTRCQIPFFWAMNGSPLSPFS